MAKEQMLFAESGVALGSAALAAVGAVTSAPVVVGISAALAVGAAAAVLNTLNRDSSAKKSVPTRVRTSTPVRP
jgi:hypothetical protein